MPNKAKTVNEVPREGTLALLGDQAREDDWVTVEAGDFFMGEGWHRRKVDLRAFQIGRYPVRVAEYRRFVEDDGYQTERWWKAGGFARSGEPQRWGEQKLHPNRPVVAVGWHEAVAYCEWNGVRLPSEAEWERAARGLTGRTYPWGDEEPDPTRANYDDNVGHPTPVGLYTRGATPEGIHDLAGNVWEFVGDWCREAGSGFVRGGAWNLNKSYLRAANSEYDRECGFYSFGFRCVRDVAP